jgi:uncharacterized protein (TIGR02270 family)
MPAILSILCQHAEQTSFLWGLRAGAVAAPHYSLADLAKLDLRVEAHIDGLRIAGDDGWQLCAKELAWEEAGEVFAAAVLALESDDKSKIDLVLNAATKAPELARGFISALGWLECQRAEPYITALCASDSSAQRRIGIAAASIHRKDPGRPLTDAFSDPDLFLRARALRAVGELGRIDLIHNLERQFHSEDGACRFWSAWSNVLLYGHSNAVQVLEAIAGSTGPFQERAVNLLFRRLSLGRSHEWHQHLASKPDSVRMAVIAAGVIGDPALIPWLVERMNDPKLSRVAGEAFTMVTGVDLAYEDLDGDKPEDFEAGPNDDPNDENVEMDPDDNLPWPDPALIAGWWDKHKDGFETGSRYLLGRPISAEWMLHVLRAGRQRQRAAAALELAILRPGVPLFEVRAPGFRQLETLNSYR